MITDANIDLKDQISRFEASLKAAINDNAKAAEARMMRALWAVGLIVTIATMVNHVY